METGKVDTASAGVATDDAGTASVPADRRPGHCGLHRAWEFLHGKVLLAYLRVRHRGLVHRVMALAVHLEDDIFPSMRRRKEGWLCLETRESDGGLGVCGEVENTFSEFPGLTAVGRKLQQMGVRRLRLDTDLEFGQIVDALMLLLYAGPRLENVPARNDSAASWRQAEMAAAMKGTPGYHRFCSNMSYNPSNKTFTVEYTYCELFFQRVIKSTVQRNAKYGDHRFLLALAPRAVLVLLVVVACLWLTALRSVVLASALLGVFGMLAAILIGQLIYAVGSQYYTQEHLNLLVQNYVKTIKRQLGEIEDSYSKLSRLEQLRDDLVHMVVHDMKNPLLAIISELEYLGELLDVDTGDEEKECLLEATSGARRLFEMVRSLLDVSRLEQGKMPLKREKLELSEIAREAAEVLGPMAREHRLTVTADTPVTVQCDRDIVRRIVVNLAGNALKYTPAGKEVAIEIDATPDGGKVQVRDRGPGIPEDMCQHIFEKFGQVEDKNEHKLYSTGLGLTFCKLAVEAHEGEIGVESVVGEGSTFWFTLPAAPADADE